VSKSEQKRICAQSECAVRDELRSQLDIKDKRIKDLEDALKFLLTEINYAYEKKEPVLIYSGRLEEYSRLLTAKGE